MPKPRHWGKKKFASYCVPACSDDIGIGAGRCATKDAFPPDSGGELPGENGNLREQVSLFHRARVLRRAGSMTLAAVSRKLQTHAKPGG